MTAIGATFAARDLDLELLDPLKDPLVRLFRHGDGDWEPAPAKYRNLRVDPPAGNKDKYAVLYMANALPAVAMECRILNVSAADEWTWIRKTADEYKAVRYVTDKPSLFLPIDGRNREKLGLTGKQRKFFGYEPYQQVAYELFVRFGELIHGLSWESFHRNQAGRVYALWHAHKATVGLRIVSPDPYSELSTDTEWQCFIKENPEIIEIAS
jgi:hypothetical protein